MQTEKTVRSVIITGGNSGLGFSAATALLRYKQAWHVIIACRDQERGASAVKKLSRIGSGNVEAISLALASLASIRAFTNTIEQRLSAGDLPPLYSVICNAGTQGATKFTVDGFESTFGVNHLGHYLLVNLLLPLLAKPTRIVVIASGVHDPVQLDAVPMATVPAPAWNTPMELSKGNLGIEASNDDETADMGRRYATSKLANMYFTYGLASRLPEGITVNAFDPGLMPGTGLAREYSPVMRFMWYRIMPHMLTVMRLLIKNVHTSKESGASLARLVTDPELVGTNGKYYEGMKEIPSSKASYDVNSADELWDDSAVLTGLTEPNASTNSSR
ncbi:SDR family NAD(P)-dependent oxidoreductase [Algoriphagus sp. AGSA1]|uniref:SDR family NAD(P)-dependent oxidoreductase n=1 Tax=Algoriphagus sp. AGSA1 TaxID=2907213 RepID=UPI001F3DBDED|nr:SDR family NAD(P)-dependent oxidoreductase [Algoriphagus sp. AGSA1]MCE7054268.1 SDR family NAD(P)-dependent oxidoreductase [Algoriphagus sp. AGSA1]